MTQRMARFCAAAVLGCAALVGGATAASGSTAARPAAAITQAQAEQIGTDAYVYGIPLMDFVRQLRTQTSVTVPNDLSDAPVNSFGSARHLASASQQVFVQPNLDTLYSMAHLDLTRTALVLHVPAVPHHRYYVLEFLDPYTNVFHYVGTRTTGDGAGNYLITGPKFLGSVPRGLRRIRTSYQHVWIAGRTLVYGSNDLPNVYKTQSGYKLVPLAQYRRHGLHWSPPRPHHVVTKHTQYVIPSGLAFYDALGAALAENPPPKADAKILAELRTVGIGPGLKPSTENLSPDVVAGLTAAADNGPNYIQNTLRVSVATPSVIKHHGWFVPYADTGFFGTDYNLRAIIAVNGLAANRPAEAIYVVGTRDSTLAALDGSHNYTIHFAAGHFPPARYFWSLTLYDSNFYLVKNVINRYALGNRSKLQHNADGSVDLYIQRTAPAGHEANWLPSPAGTFNLTLRMYGPLSSALNDTYSYPPIVRTS